LSTCQTAKSTEKRGCDHLFGRDAKGYPCEMLVDRRLGAILEFKRKLPIAAATKQLPEAVAKTLAMVQKENPKFKPADVEVIFLAGKIAAYSFLPNDNTGRETEVVIRANGERINPR
jgi:hypothetical protein